MACVIDRTQWRELNLLMLSIILHQRAIPLTWQFLSGKGNSNLAQQQALIQTILPLLAGYKVTVLGDREFCSITLAQWLKNKGFSMCLRLRRSEYIRRQDEFSHQLQQLGLKPGMSMFFSGVNGTRAAWVCSV